MMRHLRVSHISVKMVQCETLLMQTLLTTDRERLPEYLIALDSVRGSPWARRANPRNSEKPNIR
jgi:hypothetical protein